MQMAIADAAAECGRRSDIAAVVLTGGESVFAAGADIKEMSAMDADQMRAHSRVLQAAFSAVAGIPKPVVAAVHGYALGGGCELALCADHRIAAEAATFGQPEVRIGVIPGAGGTQRLTRLIGPARAKDLILTGRQVAADEALRIGLVDRVLPTAEVLPEAHRWAAQFVGGPALALAAAKEVVDRGADLELDAGLELEREHFAGLFDTEDKAIGMQHFLARSPGRPPFTGR